jgi:general secretion pathway protein I
MIDKPFSPRFSDGFTLLEVMIAVAILSMALVAALGSQSQSVSLATEAKFTTTASFLAQSKMAELETKKPTDLYSGSGDFGEDFPGYRWNVDVTNGELESLGNASKYIKKIVLVVSRNDTDRYRYELEYYRFAPTEG